MFTNVNLISCNTSSPFSSLSFKNPFLEISKQIHIPNSQKARPQIISNFSFLSFINTHQASSFVFGKMGPFQKSQTSMRIRSLGNPDGEKGTAVETQLPGGSGGGGNGGEGRDWTTSILLFVLWGGLMYYVFNLAPNLTPSTDIYFLMKLLNLKEDDGFQMNQVIVSLWYVMGLWPLVYGMLLIPSGRSSKSNIPVWPFLVLSFFGGAYALLPYFVLWKPPPPPVEEAEIKRWPLNFLESKFTAGITFAAGLGILLYAGLAGGGEWKEFFQYFRGSRFIHVMSIDFMLLSLFAPFWVYNDMTARKWIDQGSWILPLSLVPFLGPALYLVLRPEPTKIPVSLNPTASEPK